MQITTTKYIDCTAQTAAEAASRRADEKARPYILFLRDAYGHNWVAEDRYATMAELEAAVTEHVSWHEDNDDFTPQAGVDFLAVQAHDIAG